MTQHASVAPLTWRHFPAGEFGFYRAPVLVFGATEAVLIDGGFTYSDGRAIVESIHATGKRLTSIYISQSDPDYYFSLSAIKADFPNARVLAASSTVAAITSTAQKKLAMWGPSLKDNGPQTMWDVVIPQAYDEKTLSVDGQSIDIVDVKGIPNRRYLWVPSIKAIFGGVLIFSGVHVWTADTNSAALRAAWLAALDEIAIRNPTIVVPGHMTPEAPTDVSAIIHTKAWLLVFQEELAKGLDSIKLNASMKSQFPGLGMNLALDIGTKVATGEMRWI